MATGSFWNVSNPLKPWGYFDPNAQLPIPFDWSEWLTDEGALYVSHEFIFPDGIFEEVESEESDGVITILLKLVDSPVYTAGTKYRVTSRITATANGQTLIDDRTVYLKVQDR